MELQIFHIIGIIAFFQAAFLAVVVFNARSRRSPGNWIFATLLLAFALLIGYSFTHSIGIGGYFIGYHKVVFIVGQIGFLIGPLVFLYTRALIAGTVRLSRRDIVHFIPFLAALAYFTVRVLSTAQYHPWQSPLKIQYGAALLVQELVYLNLIFIVLRKHRISFKTLLSRQEDSRLVWLRLFILGFMVIWHIKLQSFVLLDVYRRWGFCPYAESLFFLVMFLFFNTVAYVALRRPEIFQNMRKYKSSDLDAAEIEDGRVRLVECMESDQPYMDPDLTLPVLARRLHIPKQHLSQIVNTAFQQNFCDFINAYRIRESRLLMSNGNNGTKTILEVAYASGFNSKSAFNRAFKKHTGTTPKEFKKNPLSASSNPIHF